MRLAIAKDEQYVLITQTYYGWRHLYECALVIYDQSFTIIHFESEDELRLDDFRFHQTPYSSLTGLLPDRSRNLAHDTYEEKLIALPTNAPFLIARHVNQLMRVKMLRTYQIR